MSPDGNSPRLEPGQHRGPGKGGDYPGASHLEGVAPLCGAAVRGWGGFPDGPLGASIMQLPNVTRITVL